MGIQFRIQGSASCDNSWMRTYNDGSRHRWECSNHEVHTEEFSDGEFAGTEAEGFRDRAMEHFTEEGYTFVEVPARPTLVNAKPEPETKCLCPRCGERGYGIDPEPDE